jgi:hypothetical protein
LQSGDWLVLCSDGLNDELTDAEIAEELRAAQGDVEKVAGLLIQRALNHGGRDNVSVVAVEYDGPTYDGPLYEAPREQEAEQTAGQAEEVTAQRAAEPAEDLALSPAQGDTGLQPAAGSWTELLRSPLVLGIAAAVLVFIVFVYLTKGG